MHLKPRIRKMILEEVLQVCLSVIRSLFQSNTPLLAAGCASATLIGTLFRTPVGFFKVSLKVLSEVLLRAVGPKKLVWLGNYSNYTQHPWFKRVYHKAHSAYFQRFSYKDLLAKRGKHCHFCLTVYNKELTQQLFPI